MVVMKRKFKIGDIVRAVGINDFRFSGKIIAIKHRHSDLFDLNYYVARVKAVDGSCEWINTKFLLKIEAKK